jgi:hypothetical protein
MIPNMVARSGALGHASSLVFAVDQVSPDSFYVCGLSAERAGRQMYRTIIAGVGGCGLACAWPG